MELYNSDSEQDFDFEILQLDSNKVDQKRTLINSRRRKYANRNRILKVIFIITMILIPTLCCLFLISQVNKLQEQVQQLSTTQKHNQTKGNDDSSVAFGAEKTSDNDNESNKDNGSNVKKPEIDSKGNIIDMDTTNVTGGEIIQNDKNNSNNDGKYANKKIYLTFDDGPSEKTNEILDILSDYQIKATFFVIGKTDEKSKEIYKRIVNEGHTLGMHSYSHNYNKIYKSLEDFDKDFTKLWNMLYDTTGYKPKIYRFPGGSGNLVNDHGMDEFIRYLNQHSMVYFDWNVLNGDATNKNYTKEQLIKNVLNGVEFRDNSIVLMHDSKYKTTTVEALSKLINTLKEGGAQFLPLTEKVAPIQMVKANSVK